MSDKNPGGETAAIPWTPADPAEVSELLEAAHKVMVARQQRGVTGPPVILVLDESEVFASAGAGPQAGPNVTDLLAETLRQARSHRPPSIDVVTLLEQLAHSDFAEFGTSAVDEQQDNPSRRPVAMPPPTHRYAGSDKARQEVGLPGHCEDCAQFGHLAAHPNLGCGDVGCTSPHSPGDPADVQQKAVVVIQPRTLPSKVEPYPYYIHADGTIGRQDKWKGNPHTLIGFDDAVDNCDVTLHLDEFLANPEAAVGMYAVFADKAGDFSTLGNPIASVRRLDQD